MSKYNADRQREYRARKRAAAAKAAQVPDVPENDTEEEESGDLNIEVEAPEAARPQSFRERMAARVKNAVKPTGAKKPARRGKKVEVNFLTKALPMLSALAATYAENLYKAPYKSCAPRREEIVAVLAPIFNVIERRLQITGELSEDALDLLASGLAMVGFIGRSYVTYEDIKRKGTVDAQPQQKGQSGQSGQPAARDSGEPATGESERMRSFGRATAEEPGTGDSGHPVRQFAGNFDGLQTSDDAEDGEQYVASNDGSDKARELAIVGAAFKQDARYRATHGLL